MGRVTRQFNLRVYRFFWDIAFNSLQLVRNSLSSYICLPVKANRLYFYLASSFDNERESFEITTRDRR